MMLKVVLAVMLFIGSNLAAYEAQARDACPKASAYLKTNAKTSDKRLAAAIRCLASRLPRDISRVKPSDVETIAHIQILASKIIGNGRTGGSIEVASKIIGNGLTDGSTEVASNNGQAVAAADRQPVEAVQGGSTVVSSTMHFPAAAPVRAVSAEETVALDAAGHASIIGNGRAPADEPGAGAAGSPTSDPSLTPNQLNGTAIACETGSLLDRLHAGRAPSELDCSRATGSVRAIQLYASKIIGNG